MKLSLLMAAAAATMFVGEAKRAIEIDQGYSDLNYTRVVADLMTSEEFVERRGKGEFDVPQTTPERHEGFELLTMTNGLSDYSETFFYVWNARGNQPKYAEYDEYGLLTGYSTYDVGYSITLSTGEDMTDFNSYKLQLIDHSYDWLFLKFKCSYDFKDALKGKTYQAYEISEFEITDSPTRPTKSNSYSISKRFAFSGETVNKVDEISTVVLNPRAAYYRIPGISGRTAEDLGEDTTVFKSKSNPDLALQPSGDSTRELTGAFTDVFYLTFDFNELEYGEIIGSKINYSIVKEAELFNNVGLVEDAFTNWPNNLTVDEDWETPYEFVPENKTVFLSTGDTGPYNSLVNLKTLPGQRGGHTLPTWWNDRAAWCWGNAAEFDLPTIQTLTPINTSGDFKEDPASDEIVDQSNNPYAIDDATASYLKSHRNSLGIGEKQYIFRYTMSDAAIWRYYLAGQWSPAFTYYMTHYSTENTNILQLTCKKNGVIYTLGVVSDNTQTKTDTHTPSNVPGFTFDWTWLYIILGIVGLFVLIKIVAWAWKEIKK